MGIRLMLKGISRGTVLAVRSLRNDMRNIFTPSEAEAAERRMKHPFYRYGMLVLILGLLVKQIKWHLSRPPHYENDPYRIYVLVLMILFYHLSSSFKWPKGVARAICVLSYIWFIFVLFYFFYLSDVLYPSP
ncbi:MAG: hypothetical protein GY845_10095 [Planctomycetes bacterium]|nr:hypothetical protein [Planctomycetota bacterium]